MNSIIDIKQILSFITIPSVFIIGIYLSMQFNWIQISKFHVGIIYIFRKKTGKQVFSSFSALAAVLGGNLGTGNIAGIAVALASGGPGALFWMWIMAFLGAIIKFTGCYLGVKYRIKGPCNHIWLGGPMYYLSSGLKSKWLAILFCIFTLFSAFTVGNLVQVNSLSLPLIEHTNIHPAVSGIVMAILVAAVLIGGIRSFSTMATKIVPIMTIVYLSCCLLILSIYYKQIFPAFSLIITSALYPESILGGALGITVFDAVKIGFDRGLFATDAGVGLAPILHAQVESSESEEDNAFTQAMVSITAPIIVMVICMLTGLVLIVTNTWNDVLVESTNLCIKSFQVGLGLDHAKYIVILTLWLFAFTTILTWSHCAERAIMFLTNNKYSILYLRCIFVLVIPIGTFFSVRSVWNLADIALNCMLLTNIIGVVLLAKTIIPNVKNKLEQLRS